MAFAHFFLDCWLLDGSGHYFCFGCISTIRMIIFVMQPHLAVMMSLVFFMQRQSKELKLIFGSSFSSQSGFPTRLMPQIVSSGGAKWSMTLVYFGMYRRGGSHYCLLERLEEYLVGVISFVKLSILVRSTYQCALTAYRYWDTYTSDAGTWECSSQRTLLDSSVVPIAVFVQFIHVVMFLTSDTCICFAIYVLIL